MPYKTGKNKGELLSSEIRRLISAHNRLSKITIPKGTKRDGLIKLIADNGFRIDHAKQQLIQVKPHKKLPPIDLPPVKKRVKAEPKPQPKQEPPKAIADKPKPQPKQKEATPKGMYLLGETKDGERIYETIPPKVTDAESVRIRKELEQLYKDKKIRKQPFRQGSHFYYTKGGKVSPSEAKERYLNRRGFYETDTQVFRNLQIGNGRVKWEVGYRYNDETLKKVHSSNPKYEFEKRNYKLYGDVEQEQPKPKPKAQPPLDRKQAIKKRQEDLKIISEELEKFARERGQSASRTIDVDPTTSMRQFKKNLKEWIDRSGKNEKRKARVIKAGQLLQRYYDLMGMFPN